MKQALVNLLYTENLQDFKMICGPREGTLQTTSRPSPPVEIAELVHLESLIQAKEIYANEATD